MCIRDRYRRDEESVSLYFACLLLLFFSPFGTDNVSLWRAVAKDATRNLNQQILSCDADMWDHVHWHSLSSRYTPQEINYIHVQTQPPTPETAPKTHKVQKGNVTQFLSMGADHVHWHSPSSRYTPLEINCKPFQTPPSTPDTAPMTHKVQKGSVKQFLSMGADHVHWHDLS